MTLSALWRGIDGETMAAPRDKFGRPIVVVTGMGIVTSLGTGKTDNWNEADRRRIRHQDGDAFPRRRPEVDDGRGDRFRLRRAVLVDQPVRASRRDGDRRSAGAVRNRQQGRFPRSAVSGGGAGRDRMAATAGSRPRRRQEGIRHFRMCCAPAAAARFAEYHHRFMFGSVAGHLAETFGTKGSPISLSTACASGATSIQLGVEAIRRGEADAALCVATDGSVNPEAMVRFSLLSALVDAERSAAGRIKAVFEEPRRVRDGRRRRRAGA